MIRSRFILMLLVCAVCSFSGKDFVSLGRHSWRCKQRVHHAEQDNSAENNATRTPVMNSPNVVISSRNVVKCCCGKICKGARGLKMHQRSCRVVHELDAELQVDIEEQSGRDIENMPEMDESSENEAPSEYGQEFPNLRKGIKLPKSDLQWSTANDYFKFALSSNQPITAQSLNANIKVLNNTVYEYFAQNFGFSNSFPNNSLVNKYKNYSIKDLKKALKTLKSTISEPEEIKYVSHTLRLKLRANNQSSESDANISHSNSQTLNHDENIGRNFWGYVKDVLNKKESVLPSLNMTQCFSYFAKTLAAISPQKIFTISSWILCYLSLKFSLTLTPHHINKSLQ